MRASSSSSLVASETSLIGWVRTLLGSVADGYAPAVTGEYSSPSCSMSGRPSSHIRLAGPESSRIAVRLAWRQSPSSLRTLGLPRRPRHTQVVEGAVVVPPVGIDLHAQVEEDLGFEGVFEIVP